jgi:hypothetical protein
MTTTCARETAALLANLEYEFLGAIAALDLLGDKVLAARGGLGQGKALLIRSKVLSMREELERVLAAIDEPITRLVTSLEGAA